MKSTRVSISYTAILRAEGSRDFIQELIQVLGSSSTRKGDIEQSELVWTQESALPVGADINEHFEWAAVLVERHEALFQRLVLSGVCITLRLGCDTNIEYALIGLDTPLFAPFVRTGISVEFCVGLVRDSA